MTLTIPALAVLILAGLIVFSGGSRIRITVGALCGSVIGGILVLVAKALFGSIGDIGQHVLNAFT